MPRVQWSMATLVRSSAHILAEGLHGHVAFTADGSVYSAKVLPACQRPDLVTVVQ